MDQLQSVSFRVPELKQLILDCLSLHPSVYPICDFWSFSNDLRFWRFITGWRPSRSNPSDPLLSIFLFVFNRRQNNSCFSLISFCVNCKCICFMFHFCVFFALLLCLTDTMLTVAILCRDDQNDRLWCCWIPAVESPGIAGCTRSNTLGAVRSCCLDRLRSRAGNGDWWARMIKVRERERTSWGVYSVRMRRRMGCLLSIVALL